MAAGWNIGLLNPLACNRTYSLALASSKVQSIYR